MYKLIIADDEKFIRKGLCNSVDWESLGFEIVADFDDGAKIIEYIKTNPVDVILSDIVMCNISGLDVAKYVYENKLSIKMLLMSGYQEFQYAHDAIKYKVHEYLLKPVPTNEIYDKFSALSKILDEEKSIFPTGNKSLLNSQQELIFDLQSIFIKNLWYEHKVSKILFDIIACSTKFQANNYNTTVAFMCHYSGEKTIKEFVKNHFLSLLEEGYLISYSNNDYLVVMFACNDDELQYKKIQHAIKILTSDGAEILFAKSQRIKESHKETSLDSRQISDAVDAIDAAVEYLESLDKLRKGSKSSLIEKFNNLNHEFVYELVCISIQILFLRLDLDRTYENTLERVLNKVDICSNDISVMLETAYNKILSYKHSDFDDGYNFAIERVKKYIKNHLDEDISVNSLASLVHLNPAYFGRYFSKATHMTVKQYIYEVKMEFAIKLLAKKEYTVFEISKKVGYEFKYFFSLFKKYTGYTPKEYLKYFID